MTGPRLTLQAGFCFANDSIGGTRTSLRTLAIGQSEESC